MMEILWYLLALSTVYAIVVLLSAIKMKYDIQCKELVLEYSALKRNELDSKIGVTWSTFYESYLYVYSNQNMIPSDKEFLEFRDSFLGYFKMKLAKVELEEYIEVFHEEKIFDDYIQYEFLKRFQKVFINSVLDELVSISDDKKKNNHTPKLM